MPNEKKPIRTTTAIMWMRLFKKFKAPGVTLQTQLRNMLAHAIIEEYLLPDEALPSSRVLAQSLRLSRTTVTLAVQALLEEGFIHSKERSGYFVSTKRQPSYLTKEEAVNADAPVAATEEEWETRFMVRPTSQRNIQKPANWQQLPYPFIYGQFDATLFPAQAWRECVLETLQSRNVRHWAPDHLDGDDITLVEQIQRRLLPARGIWVEKEEILITAGAQHATFLLAQLLVGEKTQVGIENPGYPDARNNFSLRTSQLHNIKVDAEGVVVQEIVNTNCDYVFVTTSHQCPTTVTMSLERRHELLLAAKNNNFYIIEDDHESELNFSGKPTPALKSLDTDNRVLYIGSLSKTLAHGIRLGFVVAPAKVVRELRALRRLMIRHAPTNNQRAAAIFIARGYHDAFIQRLNKIYAERCQAMLYALEKHTPELKMSAMTGGSALWVSCPQEINTHQLATSLIKKGVFIEPGDIFFSGKERPFNYMRMGYSSIHVDKIATGIEILANEMNAI